MIRARRGSGAPSSSRARRCRSGGSVDLLDPEARARDHRLRILLGEPAVVEHEPDVGAHGGNGRTVVDPGAAHVARDALHLVPQHRVDGLRLGPRIPHLYGNAAKLQGVGTRRPRAGDRARRAPDEPLRFGARGDRAVEQLREVRSPGVHDQGSLLTQGGGNRPARLSPQTTRPPAKQTTEYPREAKYRVCESAALDFRPTVRANGSDPAAAAGRLTPRR